MGQVSRAILKAYFEKGDAPSQAEFINLIDSCLNLTDDPVTGTDERVKISATDLLASYLNSKLVAGSGITFDVINPGGTEQLRINATGGGSGDMLKSIYDADDSGVVDDSELVNGLAVETEVPVGAIFTDTIYDDTTIQAEAALNTTHRSSDGKNHSDVVLNNTHRNSVSGNPHSVNKSDVGLVNAENTADLDKPVSTATQTALDLKENKSEKGNANGYAELDSGGLVPASQLPAYVDDVLEYANLAAFPATGETGKIYIALDTNITYRWGGSVYVEISSTLALGETSATAYRGDRGKTAYDHSQVSTGNPHNVLSTEITDFDTEVSNNAAVALNTAKVSYNDAAAVALNTTNRHTHSNKTILDNTTASFLTADETKLDGIEAGAEVNTIDQDTVGTTSEANLIWTGTQAEYDLLTPVSTTLYFIQ